MENIAVYPASNLKFVPGGLSLLHSTYVLELLRNSELSNKLEFDEFARYVDSMFYSVNTSGQVESIFYVAHIDNVPITTKYPAFGIVNVYAKYEGADHIFDMQRIAYKTMKEKYRYISIVTVADIAQDDDISPNAYINFMVNEIGARPINIGGEYAKCISMVIDLE